MFFIFATINAYLGIFTIFLRFFKHFLSKFLHLIHLKISNKSEKFI